MSDATNSEDNGETKLTPQPKQAPSEKPSGRLASRPIKGVPAEGKIAQTIGGGDNAKNSIVWITIRWSLIIGAAMSAGIYLRPVYCQIEQQSHLIEDLKSAWGIFMPLITLALGYIFGKGR